MSHVNTLGQQQLEAKTQDKAKRAFHYPDPSEMVFGEPGPGAGCAGCLAHEGVRNEATPVDREGKETGPCEVRLCPYLTGLLTLVGWYEHHLS